MEHKYEIPYHVNKDGSSEVFCELLDCFEQPCYFQYRKISGRNPWIFFCGNINMHLIQKDKLKIIPAYSKVKEAYCAFRTKSIQEDYDTEISKMLKENGEVVLTTAFNYVSDYVWYQETKGNELHTQHCSYLIGEDDKNYFVADSPYVFFHPEQLRWESNNSIFSIPKSHFEEAFKKYCNVTVIIYKNIPDTEQAELAYFMDICKEIVRDYQSEEPVCDGVTGRAALVALKNELAGKNEAVMKDYFAFHMLISKRVIFQRCLHIFRKYLCDTEEINKLVNLSSGHFKKMKDLAFESHYYDKKVCALAEEEAGEILKVEDALINEISRLQWKHFV